eukprot:Sspe_Gene.29909::Locus_14458_Transcript_1_3_Confidence_0.333_Length_1296::g.29909::m.29909/K02925/RP-L3e, RPL3; large subunit ribosomal protein L3e
MHKKEICEPVTILDWPEHGGGRACRVPADGAGGAGPCRRGGGRAPERGDAEAVSTSGGTRRRRRRSRSTRRSTRPPEKEAAAGEVVFERIEKHATVLRVISHTRSRRKLKLGMRKAHVCEIQENGGDMKSKLEFAKGLLEKEVAVESVFKESERLDAIRGHPRARG